MDDASRSHVFPLASPLVAGDGHTRQGRRGFHTITTSTDNAISVPLTSSQAASDGHARHVSVRSAGNVMSAWQKKGPCIMRIIKVGRI